MKKVILILTLSLILVTGLFSQDHQVVRIISDQANIRQKASTDSPIVMTVTRDTLLPLLGRNGNWMRVQTPDGKASGYIHKSLVQIENAPAGSTVSVPAEKAAPVPKQQEEGKRIEKKANPVQRSPDARPGASVKKMYLAAFYAMSQLTENQTVGFDTTIYYETAGFDSAYHADKGSGFALAFGYRFTQDLAIELGADLCSRDLNTTSSYSIPHPLWVGILRSGEVNRSGSMTENTVYLNLAYTFRLKPLIIQVSAGPCMVMAKTEIIGDYEYTEASYPFESVNLSPVITEEKQNVFGFNGSLGVGYNFGDSFTLMAYTRYISAKMSLDGDGQDLIYPSEFKLGGLKFGAGIQFSF